MHSNQNSIIEFQQYNRLHDRVCRASMKVIADDTFAQRVQSHKHIY